MTISLILSISGFVIFISIAFYNYHLRQLIQVHLLVRVLIDHLHQQHTRMLKVQTNQQLIRHLHLQQLPQPTHTRDQHRHTTLQLMLLQLLWLYQ